MKKKLLAVLMTLGMMCSAAVCAYAVATAACANAVNAAGTANALKTKSTTQSTTEPTTQSTTESTTEPTTEATSDDVLVLWPDVMPLDDLADDPNISTSDSSFQTNYFKTVSGRGNIVRVWYRNDTSIKANVTLQKYNSKKSAYESVKSFDVLSGGSQWREYFNTSTGTYRIRIESVGGKSIIGYLRVVQAKTSAAA